MKILDVESSRMMMTQTKYQQLLGQNTNRYCVHRYAGPKRELHRKAKGRDIGQAVNRWGSRFSS